MASHPAPKHDVVDPSTPAETPPDQAPDEASNTIPHEIQRPDPALEEPGKGPNETPPRP